MKFLELRKSSKEDKKYQIIFFVNGKYKLYHFGSKGSFTYVDGADEQTRTNYIKRHKVNENWEKVNAGSLSRYILWGDSKSIIKNLKSYLKRFDISE